MLCLMICAYNEVQPVDGELEMKKTFILIAALSLGPSLGAVAADNEEKPAAAPPAKTGETPSMSEIPTMKAQGERMVTLMEQLSKESNPDIRRRIMAEAMCPQ